MTFILKSLTQFVLLSAFALLLLFLWIQAVSYYYDKQVETERTINELKLKK